MKFIVSLIFRWFIIQQSGAPWFIYGGFQEKFVYEWLSENEDWFFRRVFSKFLFRCLGNLLTFSKWETTLRFSNPTVILPEIIVIFIWKKESQWELLISLSLKTINYLFSNKSLICNNWLVLTNELRLERWYVFIRTSTVWLQQSRH